jgi:hypothetical protein
MSMPTSNTIQPTKATATIAIIHFALARIVRIIVLTRLPLVFEHLKEG